MLYKYLYDLFDPTFIYDSYSCRLNKGTHKAVKRLEKFTRTVSKNYSGSCWVLKLDIKKFFDSVDHQVLLNLLEKKIYDRNILWLLREIIDSFHSEYGKNKGIPLGNLTSQVFANIYLNELDQFIKQTLRIKHYLRYADDFLILAINRKQLSQYIDPIEHSLQKRLKMELHSQKITFRKLDWGIDFLGYRVLSHYRLPSTKTKNRVFQKLKSKIGSVNFNQSLQSYMGYLTHANSYKITQQLKNKIWFWSSG